MIDIEKEDIEFNRSEGEEKKKEKEAVVENMEDGMGEKEKDVEKKDSENSKSEGSDEEV
jgi:hypothetical protein